VVRAAVDAARRSTDAPLQVVLDVTDAAPEALRALAGRSGRLVATRAAYRGIERVDNILVTAMLDAADSPLDADITRALVSLPVRTSEGVATSDLPLDLADAIEAELFTDQAAVSAQEQARFDQMLRQLEHYLADQVLLMRRKQVSVDAQIDELRQKRNRAAGVQAGDAADARLKQLQGVREQIAREIARIEEGGDDEYREWRDRLFARRFTRPEVERMLDVRFEVVAR